MTFMGIPKNRRHRPKKQMEKRDRCVMPPPNLQHVPTPLRFYCTLQLIHTLCSFWEGEGEERWAGCCAGPSSVVDSQSPLLEAKLPDDCHRDAVSAVFSSWICYSRYKYWNALCLAPPPDFMPLLVNSKCLLWWQLDELVFACIQLFQALQLSQGLWEWRQLVLGYIHYC